MGYREKIKIGFIQTNVDHEMAWSDLYGTLTSSMNEDAEEMVADELRKGFKFFSEMVMKPEMILIPEYSVPDSLREIIEKFAKENGSVVFFGRDLVQINKSIVQNKGVAYVPYDWPNVNPYSNFSGNAYEFGKKHYALEELRWFEALGVDKKEDNKNYIFDAGDFGNIGIAICSDFYDLDRFLIYKGLVHHLFIIAYNKDANSFEVLTESISRLLMCNVVICNSGYYGNSLAFSPYKDNHKRQIYKAVGANLFSVQAIELPLSKLDDDQKIAGKLNGFPLPSNNDVNNLKFKAPPGYDKKTGRFMNENK
ncbi:MAG: hypothetical protein R3Y65_04375 [Bacillota bacterium]